jgi:hypothetical protein
VERGVLEREELVRGRERRKRRVRERERRVRNREVLRKEKS